MDFSQAKLQQLHAVSTYRVYGHALDFEQEDAARQRRRPIRPCFCVWDNPDNPCSCGPETLWWLLADAVIDEGKAGRKDREGQELQFFDVLLDSNVMVESLDSVSAGALARLGDKISPARVRELGASGSTYLVAEEVGLLIVLGLSLLNDVGFFDSVEGLIERAKRQRGLA